MNSLNFVIIGKQIRSRRKALGITQEQLSEYLDVNPSHISNIESGRAHPSLTSLVAIANYLKCSIDYFISNEYTFLAVENTIDTTLKSQLDIQIENRIKLCDEKTKEKILKIIDIL